MKTFKQLREAIAKEENPEAKALRPRAQGEQDFYDAHTRNVTDYPVKGAGAENKGQAEQSTRERRSFSYSAGHI